MSTYDPMLDQYLLWRVALTTGRGSSKVVTVSALGPLDAMRLARATLARPRLYQVEACVPDIIKEDPE